MTSVIIDTDPGLDDAIAMLFALNSPEFNILGVTTVAGNIGLDTTTRNAGRLLALLDRSDIPVIPGAIAPIHRTPITELAIHGPDGLGGVVLPEPGVPPLARNAADWMAETLLAAPEGSIDILALGPLTNLAQLLFDHPAAARRIGRVVAMGGTIDEQGNAGPFAEFNLAADPEAADMLLRSGVPVTLIPLDVTRQVRADPGFVNRLRAANTRASIAAAELITAYFDATIGRSSRPLHDPCVMLYALRPDLFGTETRALAVRNSSHDEPGALYQHLSTLPCTIALTVNAPAVLKRLALGLSR
ncbi:MAG: nucleoside hydrolase [Devosia sp.]|nr:nucleoside hydrolase [Devosia sp.]